MPIVEPPRTPDEAGWEEIYGPDWPYSWLDAGQPLDVPVLENSHCRVRYHVEHQPGFVIETWDTAGLTWAEQGKMLVGRAGDAGFVYPQLVSASVLEWTPDRAVVMAVMVAAGDPRSRERVLISLQRGWTAPRFEMYAPSLWDGTAPFLFLRYCAVPGDVNCTVVKVDAASAAVVATAGSGSSLFAGGGAQVGDLTFTGENEVVLLREGAAKQANFAVVQAGVTVFAQSGSDAYGTAGNFVELQALSAYLSGHVGYCDQAADQTLEAETCPNLASGTVSVVTAAGASAGHAVQDTQTAFSNATITKASDLPAGKYRILVRAECSLTPGTSSLQAFADADGSAVATTSSAAWEWIDLGDLIVPAGAVYATVGWETFGPGAALLDRVEAVRLEDRTAAVPGYTGARDLGQSVLSDSRVLPVRVKRAA